MRGATQTVWLAAVSVAFATGLGVTGGMIALDGPRPLRWLMTAYLPRRDLRLFRHLLPALDPGPAAGGAAGAGLVLDPILAPAGERARDGVKWGVASAAALGSAGSRRPDAGMDRKTRFC